MRSLGLPDASDEMRVTAGALPGDVPTVVAALPVAQAPAKAAEISEANGSRREAGENLDMIGV